MRAGGELAEPGAAARRGEMKGKFWLDTVAVFSERQAERPADDSVKSMF